MFFGPLSKGSLDVEKKLGEWVTLSGGRAIFLTSFGDGPLPSQGGFLPEAEPWASFLIRGSSFCLPTWRVWTLIFQVSYSLIFQPLHSGYLSSFPWSCVWYFLLIAEQKILCSPCYIVLQSDKYNLEWVLFRNNLLLKHYFAIVFSWLLTHLGFCWLVMLVYGFLYEVSPRGVEGVALTAFLIASIHWLVMQNEPLWCSLSSWKKVTSVSMKVPSCPGSSSSSFSSSFLLSFLPFLLPYSWLV